MDVRIASPDEAEQLWIVRNQAIRSGCRSSYDEEIIAAWTPDKMPMGYRVAIKEQAFLVIDGPNGKPAATGFLDHSTGYVEAIFTLPSCGGQGMAGRILDVIKQQGKEQGLNFLFLSSTPNACSFYQKHGFEIVKESLYHSTLANADLLCIEMVCRL